MRVSLPVFMTFLYSQTALAESVPFEVRAGGSRERMIKLRDNPVGGEPMFRISASLITLLLLLSSPLLAQQTAPEQSQPDRVYHAGQDHVTVPVVIERVTPQYTDEARAARIAGVVSLECVVKKDGTVSVTKVIEGLGHGLDENAKVALEQFRFRPGMKDGEPVNVAFVAKINFHIPPR